MKEMLKENNVINIFLHLLMISQTKAINPQTITTRHTLAS